MKLLDCSLINFGSYKELEFSYDNLGLALVHGATGAGKSTLMDAACWVLFGRTAKGGSVEEVRSWEHNGECTTGRLSVRTGNGEITIRRTRGTQSDLFWTEQSDPAETPHRGKDISDTQRLLEARLSLDYDTFVSASYFHEFSAVGSFFTAKAKDRRELFEKLANLALPKKIADETVRKKKDIKNALDELCRETASGLGRLTGLESTIKDTRCRATDWEILHRQGIRALQDKSKNFQSDYEAKVKEAKRKEARFEENLVIKASDFRAKILALRPILESPRDWEAEIAKLEASATCDKCGSLASSCIDAINAIKNDEADYTRTVIRSQDYELQIQDIYNTQNPYKERIPDTNPYVEALQREEVKANPFTDQIDKYSLQLATLQTEVAEKEEERKELYALHSTLDHLYDLSFELRAALLQRVIKSIQDTTNDYLETYFDGEFRVEFIIQDSDKLEVSITKDGHDCSYTQLSKGQRQLLRLSFSLSVMEASANAAGVHLDTIFLDEPTDGCDTSLKLKAFSLFEHLATKHSTLLVIDHSEDLHQLFTNKLRVTLVNGHSELS